LTTLPFIGSLPLVLLSDLSSLRFRKTYIMEKVIG
jgi:hypothetical protein